MQTADSQHYRDGIHVVIVDVERTSPLALDPAVKSGNYLNNILALQAGRRRGAHEAIMCDARGRVAEGTTSNVFAVRDGVRWLALGPYAVARVVARS